MAMTRAALSTGSLGNGSANPTLHTAVSDTTKLLTVAADYFLPVYDVLKVGDFILVVATDGELLASVVTSTSAGVTVRSIALA